MRTAETQVAPLTIECRVRFAQRHRARKELQIADPAESPRAPLGRIQRISRLMGLAIRFERVVSSGEVRDYAELAALAITALFVGYMTWAATTFVYDSWKFNEVAQGLIKLPIWIPQLCFVIGVAIFFVAVLDELVTVLRGEKPAYQVAEDERRAKGDFSEMA